MRITYRYIPSPPEPIGVCTPLRRRPAISRSPAARVDERARVNRWEAEGGSLESEPGRR